MRAAATFTSVSGELDPPAVAILLAAANAMRQHLSAQRPLIEVVWTGPKAEGPLVRPTSDVITEMLSNVREAGEILIVGYSLTVGRDTTMEGIVRKLEEAARRRARITIVLHKDESEGNKKALLDAWDVMVKKPRLMTWNPSPDHPYTKLHAKTLVVDRLDLLVGSANFTFHGLSSNLELGLRVQGIQAREVAERFDFLESTGTIVEWT